MGAFSTYVRLMPVFLFVGGPLAIMMTFGIAIAKDHVYPFFPYISDTGTKPPESCIFTLCFSASSFVVFCVTYVKYREVDEFLKLKPSVKIRPVLNRISFILGIVSAVSLNVVASFQELNEFTTHFVGAVLCFFSATFYFGFQTVFTRRMYPERKVLFYLRACLTSLNIICIVGTFSTVHCAVTQFKGDDILKWKPEDGGYEFHIASTVSEWFLVLSFICFMYSFFWDFRKFDMESPVIKFKNMPATTAQLTAQPTAQPSKPQPSKPQTRKSVASRDSAA